MSEAEQAARAVFENLKEFIARSLKPHGARLAALEKRLAAAEEKAASLGHRSDRHASHLAALETRTKKLEQR